MQTISGSLHQLVMMTAALTAIAVGSLNHNLNEAQRGGDLGQRQSLKKLQIPLKFL